MDKFQSVLKNIKLWKQTSRNESKIVKFHEFFWSEKIFNLFGLSNLFSTSDERTTKKLLNIFVILNYAITTIFLIISFMIGIRDGISLLIYVKVALELRQWL